MRAATSVGLEALAPRPLTSTSSLFQIVVSRGVNEDANDDVFTLGGTNMCALKLRGVLEEKFASLDTSESYTFAWHLTNTTTSDISLL